MDLIKTLTEKVNVNKALGKLIDKLNCLEWTIPYILLVDNLPECDFKYILKLSKVKTITLTLFHAPRICAIPVELANGLGLTTFIEVRCDGVPVIPKYHNYLRENIYEVLGSKGRERVDLSKLEIVSKQQVDGFSQADVVGFIIASGYLANYDQIKVESVVMVKGLIDITLRVDAMGSTSKYCFDVAPITAEFYEKYPDVLAACFKNCLDSYKPQPLPEELAVELFKPCRTGEVNWRAKVVEFNGAFAAISCNTDINTHSYED